jgi:hypothetical protein
MPIDDPSAAEAIPAAGAAAVVAGAPQLAPKRRKWLWIVAAVVAPFVVIGIANGGGNTPTAPTARAGPDAGPAVAAPAPAAPGPAPARGRGDADWGVRLAVLIAGIFRPGAMRP